MSAILLNLSLASCWCNWHSQTPLLQFCGGEKRSERRGPRDLFLPQHLLKSILLTCRVPFYYFKHFTTTPTVNPYYHQLLIKLATHSEGEMIFISRVLAEHAEPNWLFLQLAICLWWWSSLSLILSTFHGKHTGSLVQVDLPHQCFTSSEWHWGVQIASWEFIWTQLHYVFNQISHISSLWSFHLPMKVWFFSLEKVSKFW